MRIKTIIPILAGVFALSACDGEKDLIIIDQDLPIKTSTLYMVGDATPNGWSIDAPTPMTPTDDDPLVFTWDGQLNPGEMKLCLTTGSWDAPFIRPINNGEKIGKDGVPESKFQMHAGDPDEKWKITDAGKYSLRFNLRNWTMSANYMGEPDAPVIEPIKTDALYIVGDATPNGWNIDDPTALDKKSEYIFVYEGPLSAGEFKACITTGSWDVPFVRPTSDGCKINKDGVENPAMLYCNAPDYKWTVEEPAVYRLTFDLENFTIAVETMGEYKPATKLYLIGDATDGGWSWDDAIVIDAADDDETIFVWTGELGRGTFKAATAKDFSAPFYRPAIPDCEVSKSGVANSLMVYTEDPDDKWLVTQAGKYRLTFNTSELIFEAVFVDEGGDEPVEPIQTDALYIVGDATPNGWNIDAPTALDKESDYIFVYEGPLTVGEFKACLTPGSWDLPFIHPTTDGCKVNKQGVENAALMLCNTPDNKWKVEEPAIYRLTFDLENLTIAVEATGDFTPTTNLYMIGTATPGGWSLDDAAQYTPVTGKDGEYVWTGILKVGTFKACTIKDFSAPFYRPSSSDCKISKTGITATDVVYTTDPDDQWNVVEEGTYEISINIKSMTISTKYIN